jgi:hypothetical protein
LPTSKLFGIEEQDYKSACDVLSLEIAILIGENRVSLILEAKFENGSKKGYIGC